MKSDKILIFKIICFLMFGCGIIIFTMGISLIVGIIFAAAVIALFSLNKRTSNGMIKVLAWNKAKSSGQKYYGYIYQIEKPNKVENVMTDNALKTVLNKEQYGLVKTVKTLAKNLILKIAIFDDIKKETMLIEYEIPTGLLMHGFDCGQYNLVYKYKNKYYTMPSDVIPKFVVPKNIRLEIKKKLDNCEVQYDK